VYPEPLLSKLRIRSLEEDEALVDLEKTGSNPDQLPEASIYDRVCSMFSNYSKLFSRTEFEKWFEGIKERGTRAGFTCWGQFVAMLFCQLGKAQSLTPRFVGVGRDEGKLRHLGFPKPEALNVGLCEWASSLGDLPGDLSKLFRPIARKLWDHTGSFRFKTSS